MRIAVEEGTNGYATFERLLLILDGKRWRIRVFIDREERKDVVMADEEAGELWVWQREANGEGIAVDPDTGKPKTRILRGFVQVLVDGPRPPRSEG